MAQRANTATLLWIDGKPVPCFSGAEGDEGNGDQGGNGNGSGNEGNGSGSGGDGGNGNQGAQGAAAATVTKAEFDALMARMTAADQNRAKAEKRVAELEGASKSELEKAQAALAEANAKVESLTTSQQGMLISNAFLTVKDSPTWHSNAAALKLLDNSLITIGDDGTVSGMEAAVTKLKTDHPYLVKPASADGDEGGDEGKGKGGQQNQNNGGGHRSGSNGQGRQGGGKQGKDRAELEKRFPALRGR